MINTLAIYSSTENAARTSFTYTICKNDLQTSQIILFMEYILVTQNKT